MKALLIMVIVALSIPCKAQWIYDNTNVRVNAFGSHDTSFYYALDSRLYRANPNGYADNGLDLTQGPMTSFVSLGSRFFAGSYNPKIEHGIGAMSTDNGSTWKTVVGGPIGTNGTYVFGLLGVLPNGDSTVVARSRDTGRTWERIMYPPGLSYVGNGAVVYSNTLRAGVIRSLDSGTTWSPVAAPFWYGQLVHLGTVIFLYQPYHRYWSSIDPPHSGVCIMSRDSGMTWDTLHVDSSQVPELVTTVATDGKNLFVGGHNMNTLAGNGIFVSTDTGRTWRSANDGIGIFHPIAFGIWDTMLYVSLSNDHESFPFGTYYRPISELVGHDSLDVVESRPPLAQDTILVYPNPSPGIFTVEAPNAEVRSVTVLNLLGESLLMQPGGNAWSTRLDLSRLPSGTYFLQIETERGVVMRKVVRE